MVPREVLVRPRAPALAYVRGSDPLHVSPAGRRSRMSEGTDELKATLSEPGSPRCTRRRGFARPRRRPGRPVAHRSRRGRGAAARDRSRSRSARCSCRSTSRGWRRTHCSRGRSPPRSRSRPWTRGPGSRRKGRRDLDRLGDPARQGRDRVRRDLVSVLLFIWMERKVIADIQTRLGPMRAGPAASCSRSRTGSSSSSRRRSRPTQADPWVYRLAPMFAVIPGFLAFAIVPSALGVHLRPDRRAPTGGPVDRRCSGCSR